MSRKGENFKPVESRNRSEQSPSTFSLKLPRGREKQESRSNLRKQGAEIEEEGPSQKFNPSVLPDKLLDNLWQVANRKNITKLREKIERERFRRLEQEVRNRRSVLFYQDE